MRHLLAALAVLLAHASAYAETIRQVIERGILEIVADAVPVDTASVPRIIRAFAAIKQQVGDPLIMIKVVERGQPALTAGKTIVIHRSIESLSEIEIEFIIAHEVAHIRRNHKERRIQLYEKYIVGDLTPEKAAAADSKIGPEMQRLSWECEFEADRDALVTLTQLGRSKDDVITAFLTLGGRTPDTATHPSTGRRAMNLRRED